MRTIGTIPRGEDAERFSDYLLTQNIDNMVEESSTNGPNGNWLVWVEHDRHYLFLMQGLEHAGWIGLDVGT